MKRDPNNLPIMINKRFFYQLCCDRRDRLVIYTDWMAKLQRFHRPVNKWIRKKLSLVEEVEISTIRFDTYDLVKQMQWFRSNVEELRSIRRISIKAYAIDRIPPWIYCIPNLEEIQIHDDYNYLVYSQSLGKDFNGVNPVYISSQIAEISSLRQLTLFSSPLCPIFLDPEFPSQNHITHLQIAVDGFQTPLSELSRFPVLEKLEIWSRQPLLSYDFLTTLTTIKELKLTNELSFLPDEISTLQKLEILDISDNYIHSIPSWIASLPVLRMLIIDNPPSYSFLEERIAAICKDLAPLQEFPHNLQNCQALIYCTLGVSARSLYNLPPSAQYWAALTTTFGHEFRDIPFDLPQIVIDSVYREFEPSFRFFQDYRIIRVNPDTHERYYGEFVLEYGLSNIDIYLTRGYPKICILCGSPLLDRKCPLCRNDLETHEKSLKYTFYCEQCNTDITVGLCPQCGLDNRLGSENHPNLVAFLNLCYADSYETLVQNVKNGEKLLSPVLDRFIHETTYQYYQLLSNSTSPPLDPSVLDALAAKFSVEIGSKTKSRILL